MNELSPIQSYYKNAKILVTGSTGFLGRVLIEKLLRSCSELDTLYLLIRNKKGKVLNERLDELFEDIFFDKLRAEQPNFREKVIGISGDCSLENLGLNEESTKILLENVTLVFHSAATVRFDEPLTRATAINVRGTRDLLALCARIPSPAQLRFVVHVSTAYSHCTRRHIAEQFYPPPLDPNQLITLTETLTAGLVDDVTPRLLGDFPNTYTFTKACAEEIVRSYGDKLPIAIVRPSIIISTYKEPIAGWINNLYGPVGVTAAAMAGLLCTLHCNPVVNANIIPVDMLVNAIIATPWYHHHHHTKTTNTVTNNVNNENTNNGDSTNNDGNTKNDAGNNEINNSAAGASNKSISNTGSTSKSTRTVNSDKAAVGSEKTAVRSEKTAVRSEKTAVRSEKTVVRPVKSTVRSSSQVTTINDTLDITDSDSDTSDSTDSTDSTDSRKDTTGVNTVVTNNNNNSNDNSTTSNNSVAILDNNHVTIYNYESSGKRPISWGHFQHLTYVNGVRVPTIHAIRHYSLVLHPRLLRHRWAVLWRHWLPAVLVDGTLKALGRKTMLCAAYDKLHKFAAVISYFATTGWTFDGANVQQLCDSMLTVDSCNRVDVVRGDSYNKGATVRGDSSKIDSCNSKKDNYKRKNDGCDDATVSGDSSKNDGCNRDDSCNRDTVRIDSCRNDRQLFMCDLSQLDWDEYFKTYPLGVRKFLLKDGIETLPAAKRKFNRLQFLHHAINGVMVAFLCYIIYTLYCYIF